MNSDLFSLFRISSKGSIKRKEVTKKGDSLPVEMINGQYWIRTSDPLDVNDAICTLEDFCKYYFARLSR